MRYVLAVTLIMASVGAYAADDAASGATAAADAKAVNTVCVMCGKPVDPKIAPIAAKTSSGKAIMIGCCSEGCAAEVKKSPDTYADAAVSNKPWKKEEKVK